MMHDKKAAPHLVVGIAQINPHPADVAGNADKICEYIVRAKAAGVELLVFPETVITAYAIGDRHKDLAFIRENKRLLVEKIAPLATGITVIIGFIDFDEQRRMKDGFFARYNAYAVLADGAIHSTGRKTLLVDDGVLDDSRHYIPGAPEAIRPVDVSCANGDVKVGVLVCQDIWDDDEQIKPAAIMKRQGAELLVVLNASPFYVGKGPIRAEVAQRRVRETKLPLVYCNTVGAQDNGKNIILFDGASFVLDSRGRIVHCSPRFAEDMAVVPFPLDGKEVTLAVDNAAELHEALVFGIRDFFTKTGVFKGAVIGVSGGIDSAVDASLLVEALGKEHVLCLNMPSRFNSATTKGAAAQLAVNLGCEYIVHPIQDVVEKKIADFRAINHREPKTLTVENMQARERGNILMEYSQERGFMVVGNGNKTEFQRGYATLYGDIIGALMPLGDVNKLDVYRLGCEINRRFGRDVIPASTFAIIPSAELSDAQDVDKGQGDPFDYYIESPLGVELIENMRSTAELVSAFERRTLSPALWVPDEKGRSVYDKLTAPELERMAVSTLRAIKMSYFKRVQAPPIIIVSKRAFGFDYRETLLSKCETL